MHQIFEFLMLLSHSDDLFTGLTALRLLTRSDRHLTQTQSSEQTVEEPQCFDQLPTLSHFITFTLHQPKQSAILFFQTDPITLPTLLPCPPPTPLHRPYLGNALIGLNSVLQKHFVSMSAYCRGGEALSAACVCECVSQNNELWLCNVLQ